MDDIDMDGVDPRRWEGVRRRIGVVRRYLALPSPTDADRLAHAQALDLGINQFMALVRAWRLHGSAAKIAGSGAHRGGHRRASRLAVPEAVKTVAEEVIQEQGADAALATANREIAARCERLGLRPPSRSTVWNMLHARRQARQGNDDGVLVGTCRVRLPVREEGRLWLPTLTLAVRAGNGTVLAAAIPATYADWVGMINSVAGNSPRIEIDEELLPTPATPLSGVTAIASPRARAALSRVLGCGLDDLHLAYLAGRAIEPGRLLTTSDDRPLTMSNARQIVSAAAARHNAARGAPEPLWIYGPSRSPEDAAS